MPPAVASFGGNEFGFLGENAVVSVGTAELNDATKPTYPRDNVIQHNHMHDIGLWTKQVAGYTQFLTARATLQSNVIYNCPRAGINLNDNAFGGNVVEMNLVYNTVRETNDHGTLNSWARTGFINVEAGPTPSYDVLWNQVRNNMLVCGFSANNHALWGLDYDDGTEYMNSTANVLVYSGFKACWHSNNQRYVDNLLIRPDMQSMDGHVKPQPCACCVGGAPAAGSFQAETKWMKNESFINTVCIDDSIHPKNMHFGGCDSTTAFTLNGTSVFAQNSTYYGRDIFECGKTYNLSQWQELWRNVGLPEGGEYESQVIAELPSTAEILNMARQRLRMQTDDNDV